MFNKNHTRMKRKIFTLLLGLVGLTAFGQTITVAEAMAICAGLKKGASTTETYTVVGYVTYIKENSMGTDYNNMSFYVADTKNGGTSTASGAFLAYRCRPPQEVKVGDKVSITSVLKNYNGTYETGTSNAPVEILEYADDDPGSYTPEEISVAQAMSLCGGLAKGEATKVNYKVIGYVTAIKENAMDTTFKNMSFFIDDTKDGAKTSETGAFYAHRCKPTEVLKIGDKVSITTVLTNYNGIYETGTSGAPVEILEHAPVVYGPITVQLSPKSPFIQNWSSVGLYAWLTDENDVYIQDALGMWPGIVVSKDAKTGWFSYTFPQVTNKLHIIWNNNDGEAANRQSVDIDGIYESTCYMLTDETDDMGHAYYKVIACPTDSTIIPIDPDTTIIPIDPDTTIIPIDPDTTIIPIDPDTTIIPIDPDTTIIPGKTYTLTVAAGEGGSVNNAGGAYNAGTVVSLQATAQSGFRFHSWSDGNTESPRAMKITQDEALFAVFLPEYRLSVSAEKGGTVNESVNGAYTEAFCVEIEATPEEGWKFLRWSDDETDNPRTLYMTEDITLSALFNQRQGLDDIVSANAQVWDAGKRIGIRCSVPQTITVYTAAGRELTVLTDVTETTIPVPTGLYIVRTNNHSYKLIVK